MKTLRSIAKLRAFIGKTFDIEHETFNQKIDRANLISHLTRPINPEQAISGLAPRSAHNVSVSDLHAASRLITAVTIIMFTAVPILWNPVKAFAQYPQGLTEALDNQKAGRLKEAIEIYTEVIAKNPRSAEAYNWRGMAYEDLGELDKALADFNKAIAIAGDYADAFNNRGEIYRMKNMVPQATADYRRATQLEKDFAEAYYNLGLMYESQKHGERAIAEYENYLKYKPDAADKQQVLEKIQTLKKAAAAQRPHPHTAGERPGLKPAVERPLPGKPTAPSAVPGKPPVEKPGLPKQATSVKPATPAKPVTPAKPAMPVKPHSPSGIDLGIPGVPQIPANPEALLAAVHWSLIDAIISLAVYLFFSIMFFLIAVKTNTSLPWLAFIPIANIVLMLQIARKPIWWLLLLFLPLVTVPLAALEAVVPTGGMLTGVGGLVASLVAVIAWLYVNVGIATAREKSAIWGVLLFIPCTTPIALAYLGLSK